jgi:hypothetical protein
MKRRLDSVSWAREVVSGLRGVNEWLEAEFERAAEAADGSVRPKSSSRVEEAQIEPQKATQQKGS